MCDPVRLVIPALPPRHSGLVPESSLLNGRLRHFIRCPFGTFLSLDSRLRGNDEGVACLKSVPLFPCSATAPAASRPPAAGHYRRAARHQPPLRSPARRRVSPPGAVQCVPRRRDGRRCSRASTNGSSLPNRYGACQVKPARRSALSCLRCV